MKKVHIKGTVSVISSDLHAKMTMPDLQQYPWKLFYINYELDIHIHIFVFELFIFNCNFPTKVTCGFLAYRRYKGEMIWNRHFLSQKNDDIFHIFNQIKVSRVSGIVIFVLRVFWNFA